MKIELGKELIEKTNYVEGVNSFKIVKYVVVGESLYWEYYNKNECKKMIKVMKKDYLDKCLGENEKVDIGDYGYDYSVEEINKKFVESEEEYKEYFGEKIKKLIEEKMKEIEKLKSVL